MSLKQAIRLASMGVTTALSLSAGMAVAANCATVAEPGALKGKFPQQLEMTTYVKQAGQAMKFGQNPAIAALNKRIMGNPELPVIADRLPAEPLVVMPYDTCGTYGGTLKGLSKGTESGTSDLLSIRHVNLVRYSDDLKTVGV